MPVIRRILRYVRAFPIPNNALGFKMIAKPAGDALRRGYHVLILPEGDLCYLSQEIFRFKPGAFYMSCYHQAPILPIVYVLTKRIKNGVEKNPHRPRIHQVIGAPMYPPLVYRGRVRPPDSTRGRLPKARHIFAPCH